DDAGEEASLPEVVRHDLVPRRVRPRDVVDQVERASGRRDGVDGEVSAKRERARTVPCPLTLSLSTSTRPFALSPVSAPPSVASWMPQRPVSVRARTTAPSLRNVSRVDVPAARVL